MIEKMYISTIVCTHRCTHRCTNYLPFVAVQERLDKKHINVPASSDRIVSRPQLCSLPRPQATGGTAAAVTEYFELNLHKFAL